MVDKKRVERLLDQLEDPTLTDDEIARIKVKIEFLQQQE